MRTTRFNRRPRASGGWRFRLAWFAVAAAAAAAEAPAPAAARPDGPVRGPAERFVGLQVVSAQPKLKAEMPNGLVFDLDPLTMGLYAMADFAARTRVEPPNVTLPMAEPGAVIEVRFDANGRALRIGVRGGGDLGAFPLPPADRTVRVCLHQRDQVALYAVTPAGAVAQVGIARVDYKLTLPDADQYALCRRLDARMGDRTLSREEVLGGVRLDCLDEARDIVVAGLSPLGAPFEHRYTADLRRLEGLLEAGTEMLLHTLRQSGAGAAP